MEKARYRIMFKNTEGDIGCAFTWTRSAHSGIARAIREAKEFGIEVTDVWAEAV